jgi:hypothetical protein
MEKREVAQDDNWECSFAARLKSRLSTNGVTGVKEVKRVK